MIKANHLRSSDPSEIHSRGLKELANTITKPVSMIFVRLENKPGATGL